MMILSSLRRLKRNIWTAAFHSTQQKKKKKLLNVFATAQNLWLLNRLPFLIVNIQKDLYEEWVTAHSKLYDLKARSVLNINWKWIVLSNSYGKFYLSKCKYAIL